jgi:Sensors of blue-light using FAD
MLVRCLYASHAQKPIGDAVLDTILKQSRRKNPVQGITGMLCFANGIFVQVIEGGRADVSRLLGTIFRDDRHTGLEVLSFEEIPERRFGNWTMGQVNMTSVNPALLLKYSEKAELNPFSNRGGATLSLLLEIAEAGGIVQRQT